MNSFQAKQIKITDFLNIQNDKNEFFIKSPFNPNEKTASFKIDSEKNIWYDHAQGFGGNIIDLVMKLKNCSFQQALKHLENNTFSFSPAKVNEKAKNNIINKQKKEIEIKKIQSIQNLALIEYLKNRKINIEIAKKYLKEIYYTQNQKNYFSLAFKNDSEGYETRNPYFKGCIGTKDITTIKSSNNNKVSIFEGFMDFLSALTYFKKNKFQNDVIILNSLSNLKKINSKSFSKVYLFLDNDIAGKSAKLELYNKNKNCIDCSNIYFNQKDFNEFLIKKNI